MKIYFLCRIFGHKFNRAWNTIDSYEDNRMRMKHCARCGLTIEEIRAEEDRESKAKQRNEI